MCLSIRIDKSLLSVFVFFLITQSHIACMDHNQNQSHFHNSIVFSPNLIAFLYPIRALLSLALLSAHQTNVQQVNKRIYQHNLQHLIKLYEKILSKIDKKNSKNLLK